MENYPSSRACSSTSSNKEAAKDELAHVSASATFRSTEETMAELRRENFRLRLVCYEYEKNRKRMRDPEDAESSRLFSVEAENLNLKETLAEKSSLLNSASRMIETLKQENDFFREQLKESRKKIEANESEWRSKYDAVCVQLQQAKEVVCSNEMKLMTQEHEWDRQKHELQSNMSDLQLEVRKSCADLERMQHDLNASRSQVRVLQSALAQVDGEKSRTNETVSDLEALSHNIHTACQRRFEQVSTLVHALIKQITDSGMTTNVTVYPEQLIWTEELCQRQHDSVRQPLAELPTNPNQIGPHQHTESIGKYSGGSQIVERTTDESMQTMECLSERLNAARILIQKLANEKFKHDDMMSDLSSEHDDMCRKVADMLGQVDRLMKCQNEWVASVGQHNRDLLRLREQQAELESRVKKELDSKDQLIKHLQLVLSIVNGAGDVTQQIKLDETDTQMDQSAWKIQSNLSASGYVEISLPKELIPNHNDAAAPTPSCFAKLVSTETEHLQNEVHFLQERLDQKTMDYNKLKDAYDALSALTVATNTQVGSLSSDGISTMNVTKDLTHSIHRDLLNTSVDELGTVSTPSVTDGANLDDLVAFNREMGNTLANFSSPEISLTSVDRLSDCIKSKASFTTSRLQDNRALSTSGLVHNVSIAPNLDMSLPGRLESVGQPRLHLNTPVQGVPVSEPQSLAGLRDLYNLVHGLREQLDNVRFTQHSFVEMVNRSLTANPDFSSQLSPTKLARSVCLNTSNNTTELNFIQQLSYMSLTQNHPRPSSTVAEAGSSHANATFGMLSTMFDHDSCADCSVDQSVNEPNLTVNELRAYPHSPVPSRPKSVAQKPPVSSRDPIARLKGTNRLGSVSMCDEPVGLTKKLSTAPQSLSVSFAVDDKSSNSTSKRNMGDLTMVEWQNREIFEQLAEATAKLRDALEQCAAATAPLWAGDASQYLSQLFLDDTQIRTFDNSQELSHCVADAPAVLTSPTVPLLDDGHPESRLDQSVLFDRANSKLAPSDFAQLTEDASLSLLYGPTWFTRENSWSDKVENKVSVDIQTSSSKPTSLTLPPSDSAELVMLQRYVSLLTHALSVFYKTVSPASDKDEWLQTWTESIVQWFQSYLSALNETTSSATAASTTTLTVHRPDDTMTTVSAHTILKDVETLLGRMESVFNERIDDWVTKTKSSVCKKNVLSETIPVNLDGVDGEVCEPRSGMMVSKCAQQKGTSHLIMSNISGEEHSDSSDLLLLIKQLELPDVDKKMNISLTQAVHCLVSKVKQDRDTINELNDLHAKAQTDLKHLDELRQSVHNYEQTLTDLKDKNAYIRQRIQLIYPVVSSGEEVTDCVDLLMHEYTGLQTRLTHMESRLSSSVSQVEYEQCQNDLRLCSDELKSLKYHLEENEAITNHMIEKLSPFTVPATSTIEMSLSFATSFTDSLVSILTTQRDSLDRLSGEQEQSVAILSTLLTITEPRVSLIDSVRHLSRVVLNERVELEKYRKQAECLQVMLDGSENVFEGFDMDDYDYLDKNEIVDRVELLFCLINEQKLDMSDYERVLTDLRSELANTIPKVKYDRLEKQLNNMSDALNEARAKIGDLESEVGEFVHNSVPLDQHQNVNQQLVDAQRALEQLESTQSQIQAILLREFAGADVENLCDQIELICTELTERRETVVRLQTESKELRLESDRLRIQSDAYQSDMDSLCVQLKDQLESLQFEYKLTLAELDEVKTENIRLNDQVEQLTVNIREGQVRFSETEQKCKSVQAMAEAFKENLRASSDVAAAHESRAEELSEQLRELRAEHQLCSKNMTSAQTSTVAEQAIESQQNRLRKYAELKSVAFELKEKVVQRTDKLEAALTEVARLRSVIQQDKEHASRVLEEVEDLRLQALRKNKKISDLEHELTQLRKSASSLTGPVASARNTRSSITRTVSEQEQFRGGHCAIDTPLHSMADRSSLNASIPTSFVLAREPASLRYPNQSNDASAGDSASLLFASSDQYPERESKQVVGQSTPECCRCGQLQTLVVNLRTLSGELKQQVDLDLTEERMLLNNLEQQQQPHLHSDGDSKQTTLVNLTAMGNQVDDGDVVGQLDYTPRPDCSNASVCASIASTVGDLKGNIEALRHARSQLVHYAVKMDNLCSSLLCKFDSPNCASLSSVSESNNSKLTTVQNSIDLLHRTRRRLVSFFNTKQLLQDETARKIMSELKRVIRNLSDSTGGRTPNPTPTDMDKENRSPKSLSQSTDGKRQLSSRAERSRRHCHQLEQGLYSVAKELRETTKVLVSTRSNLERTSAGLKTRNAATGNPERKTQPH